VAKLAGVQPLRIHDLRHFAASTLTGAGVEDNIIGLLTGHKSRELRRYPWNRISPLPAMVEML
jgi:integrase